MHSKKTGSIKVIVVLTISIFIIALIPFETVKSQNSSDSTSGQLPDEPIFNTQYTQIDGVNRNLLSLDIYPTGKANSPIMLGIHGGGWVTGDKATRAWVGLKARYFNAQGFIFISVNYRLSPKDSEPNFRGAGRIKYPDQPEDISAALAWIKEHAPEFGGDNKRISMMGHSAGAGMISLISTDTRFFEDSGLNFNNFQCSILLDGDAYDVADKATVATGRNPTTNSLMYQNAFATLTENNDNEVWSIASPVNYVEEGKSLPDFFIVTRGGRARTKSNYDFAAQINASGNYAEILDTQQYNHEEVNRFTGGANDMTTQMTRFLARCK